MQNRAIGLTAEHDKISYLKLRKNEKSTVSESREKYAKRKAFTVSKQIRKENLTVVEEYIRTLISHWNLLMKLRENCLHQN